MRLRGPAKRLRRCKSRIGLVLGQGVNPAGLVAIRIGLQDGTRQELQLGPKEFWRLVANVKRQWKERIWKHG